MSKPINPPPDLGRVKIPTRHDSPLRWSMFVGICFGVIRLLIGGIFVSSLGVGIFLFFSGSAAIFAGVAGGYFWRRQVNANPSAIAGAIAGVLAGSFSYIGLSLVSAVVGIGVGIFQSESLAEVILVGMVGSLFAGIVSAFLTGLLVFPALAITGACLGAMQRSSIPNKDSERSPK